MKEALKFLGWVLLAAFIFLLLIVIIALSDPGFRAMAN